MPDRQPIVAGSFYPADAQELRTQINGFMAAARLARPDDAPQPLLCMLPHAGYVYSGQVAALGLAGVRAPETVFLLGPNHTRMGAPLAVWPDGAWHTPLGAAYVDPDLGPALIATGTGFTENTTAHLREHSLEVLLPFLQVCMPKARIVPIAVAESDPQRLKTAGEALAWQLLTLRSQGKNPLVIVSSDMHHFATHDQTLQLDDLALERILAMDPTALYGTVRDRNISMCGVLPMTLGLFMALACNATTATLLDHTTSAPQSGDYSNTVGYAAIHIH